MTSTTRPDPPEWLPDPNRNAPNGWQWVAEPEAAWTTTQPSAGNRCRFGASPTTRSCKRPAVAWLDRRGWWGAHRPNWWAYCDNPDHLFGRWIDDGVVMHWELRPR